MTICLYLQSLEEDLTRLELMADRLGEVYDMLVVGNAAAKPKVDEAIAHANSLKLQATDLTKYVFVVFLLCWN